MGTAGPRWYVVRCKACTDKNGVGTEHGFSAGALAVLVRQAQEGELITTRGNTFCLVDAIRDYTPHSLEPRFAFTETVK